MSFAKILTAVAAASMAVTPVMAASANPAAGLSLAPAIKSLRASAPTAKKSKLSQGATIAIVVVVVGGAIGGIVAGTTGGSSR
ncbi:MAG: hypothetical protein K2W81_13005 [Sphingomonas sp.]|uniref:hypothetical protein n=1 Tax=Sphingomonas sp. TaxID=28214 RepID=UPI0025CFCE5B|nr:hypothetical protein [Sphingomonas sp.]MBY0284864.1 hypothetical protein [Sphingomonas sp.]